MRAGVVYPQVELGGDPGALVAFAQAAEELGYDHFMMYDHVLGAQHAARTPELWGPYKEDDPFHEVLTSFAYLAGLTKRLEFVTGVLVLPQRQTALVAKQVADIDLFSNGRVRLGVGIGWNWVEYDALEVGGHYGRRGMREELQIALIRRLWSEPLISQSDTFHTVDRAGLLPLPSRDIPIWLGGFSEPAFSRAARIGDGFIFSAERQGEAVRGKTRLDELLAVHGRCTSQFGCESLQRYDRGADQWSNDIAAWRDAGGSHMSIMTMNAGLETVDEHINAIRQWHEVYVGTA